MGNQTWRIFVLGALVSTALGNDVLRTSGFSTCMNNAQITVQNLDIQYDRQTKQVTFNVAGTSTTEQKVTASLQVSAYGKPVYSKDFNPCDNDTFVQQLCPVPAGTFAAQGVQDIPDEFAGKVPSIAFNVPDLEGQATLELKTLDGGQELACIQSDVQNGKTIESPAISYIAVGIAGAALILTGVSALSAAGTTGSSAPSPNFGDVLGWFQSVATNGMLSVNYPPVYRSYTRNFAFSGGLIPWNSMQRSIDSFRKATGGNLTEDSVEYLRNSTLVYNDDSGNKNSSALSKRFMELAWAPFEPALVSRDELSTTINGTQTASNTTSPGNGTTAGDSKVSHLVHGIQGYVEQLTIPQANTFMTVLLIFAIVIAAVAVGILLFKVILEIWALFASFPKKLTGFRKRYWGLMGRTITNLILMLYGIWTLYCVFQFTHGDSWAAKLLAGLTLGIFTIVLWGFVFQIWRLARKYKKLEGDTSVLFEDKEIWRKYSLFYDNYKRGYWWLFVPAIIYMFARGCVIAGGNGHGLAQTAGQLIVESLFMVLVLVARPFATSQSNWINIFIHVVRVLSVVCILVFVEELGIAQSTKTITGVILIAVQSSLTVLLGILIAVNAIIICVRENPHRKQRKEAEKLNRDLDNLTPLDARNSLLIDPMQHPLDKKSATVKSYPLSNYGNGRRRSSDSSMNRSTDNLKPYTDNTPPSRGRYMKEQSSEHLVGAAVPMGMTDPRHQYHSRDRSGSSSGSNRNRPHSIMSRQPTIPDFGLTGEAHTPGYGHGQYRGQAY